MRYSTSRFTKIGIMNFRNKCTQTFVSKLYKFTNRDYYQENISKSLVYRESKENTHAKFIKR